MNNADRQYGELYQQLVKDGQWVRNERTGKNCLTLINTNFEYDVGGKDYPLITTKLVSNTPALAEMLGYIRGYTSAADFRRIGCKTWDANANKTQAWLNNPNRKGADDMGKVYGAVARDFGGLDLIDKVYNNLKAGIDDRREIITFYKPDEFHLGCLRPCMHSHHFSLVSGVLHMTSTQASADVPLGLPFNMVQAYFLLDLMAKITGNKAGKVYHNIVNLHVYEDQLDILHEQMRREPIECAPELEIGGWVKSMEHVMDERFDVRKHCTVLNYESHPRIGYPFSE